MLLTQTVGVAPGTTTLQFSGLGQVFPGVAAKSINWIPAQPAPPEEKRWFMPDRAEDMFLHHHAYPKGFKGLGAQRTVYYDAYQRDFWKLRGLGGKDNIRWDLIAVVGGGAFIVALATSIIASAIR